MGKVDQDELVVGLRYHVEFEDCCVSGEFAAVLIAIERKGEYIHSLYFDNGVELGEIAGVSFALMVEPDEG